MIFIIPIILGAVALGTTVAGVAKGAKGIKKMKKAKKIAEGAEQRYEYAVHQFSLERDNTNKQAQDYGQLQLNIMTDTIERFVAFIEQNGQRAMLTNIQAVEGLNISVEQISQYKSATVKAQQLIQGGTPLLVATAGYSGAMGLATSVGVASTGTAISQLSGAAATNATLAWLGGGSLAAGGGGMALGSLVLGGITLGPALMLSGFAIAAEGKKAKKQAKAYEAEANIAIAKIDAARDVLQQVKRQIGELKSLVENINDHAISALEELESQPFDLVKDASKFQQIALLVKSLVEIMKLSILDERGNLNPEILNIKVKYCSLK
ncbi:MAG: hypothetical protein LRZ84_27120 [Desertifilum sp.]|nr:hypothetical protein [Desertifilum sp.]